MSTSKNTMTGGCLCGNVRYDLTDIKSETLDGVVCHCTTCRKMHTVLSYNTMIDAKQLKISKGTPKSYEDNSADSGNRIVRSFCGDCGSGLYSTPDSIPGKIFVKAGSLDEAERVVPKSEIYIERALVGNARSKDGKMAMFEGMMAKRVDRANL